MTYNAVNVDMFYDGVWNSVTGKTLERDRAQITRGAANEGGGSAPTSCSLSLRNDDSRFSSRNPSGPLFGKIGRNTPLRVHLGTPHVGAADSSLTDSTSHVAPAVDAPTSTGVLMCAWAAPEPSASYTIPGSMTSGGTDITDGRSTMGRAYEAIASSGSTGTRTATFSQVEDWTAASVLLHGESMTVQSTPAATTGEITIDSASQAGWWLVLFGYWAWDDETESIPNFPAADHGGWLLLGDTGTLQPNDPNTVFMRMKAWAMPLKHDGAQTVRMRGPSKSMMTAFVVSGVGTWDMRCHTELSSMPPRREISDRHRWVPVQSAGVLRRLGASNNQPLQSALYRHVLTTAPRSYWTLEDGQDTQRFWQAAGRSPMRIGPRGELRPAAVDGPDGSDQLPEMKAASTGEAFGAVDYPDALQNSEWQVMCWLHGTHDSSASFTAKILNVYTSGSVATWSINVTWSSGTPNIAVTAIDTSGSTITSTTISADILDGDWHLLTFRFEQNGSDVDFTALVDGSSAGTLTVSSHTQGSPRGVRIRTNNAAAVQTLSVGHIGVWAGLDVSLSDLVDAGAGHAGETAGRRIERLCAEEGIVFAPIGDLDTTAFVGPQGLRNLLDLITEAAEADHGMLYEPRESLGLAYRTRSSMYSRDDVATLDYDSGQVAPPLEPEPDEFEVNNDVTVSRVNGSSARVVRETGPLNVSDPADDPQGVGRYETSVTVNLAYDLQLGDQAGWLLRLGTVDEPRFPTIAANLVREQELSNNPTLVAALARMDIGDRLVMKNPPPDISADDVTQLVLGMEEVVTSFERVIRFNCAPESPYRIANYADTSDTPGPADPVRRDTAGSQVASGLVSPGSSGDYASTPDDASLDITGDIDLRAWVVPADQSSGSTQAIVSKYETTGNQRSYALQFGSGGLLNLLWSTDGSSSTSKSSTVPPQIPAAGLAVRATLDVNDGSSQHVVTFYTASSLDGPWTQLGSAVTTAGTTSIFAGTAPLEVGSRIGGTSNMAGLIYAAQVLDGIDGTVVANPDFTAQTPGDTSFSDDAGLTWTVNGNAEIVGDFVAGTDTSLWVHTTQGPLWGVTGDANIDLPFDLASLGARLRVSAIAAAVGQVQEFTVSATVVNGVAKTIPAGTDVRLWQPAVRGL